MGKAKFVILSLFVLDWFWLRLFVVHQGGHPVYLQYSNWRNGEPSLTETSKCVVVDQNNEWLSFDC